jgi:taurine dioxygenase
MFLAIQKFDTVSFFLEAGSVPSSKTNLFATTTNFCRLLYDCCLFIANTSSSFFLLPSLFVSSKKGMPSRLGFQILRRTSLIPPFAIMAFTAAAAKASPGGVCAALVPPLDSSRVKTIEQAGITIRALDPMGAEISGLDLRSGLPEPAVLKALEQEMATRGFFVFKKQSLSVDELLSASEWWGGQEIHSTHGVHPATPGRNRDIFRLSNDQEHGILGVGPQWHNDGSFVSGTFSHVGYHIIRPAENGGGTYFAHQGAAFDVLPKEKQEFWSRLVSVNSNSGVLHPVVHEHPISKRKSVWLHLGMTGAVIEKLPGDSDADPEFRLLGQLEMENLFNEYNDVLNAGTTDGYSINYEYEDGDCIFIDNLAVSHRASPEAHLPASVQGLRILHRTTVKATQDFAPSFGLPQFMEINGPSPFGKGVWQGGGIGFRWNEGIHMQN